MCSCVLNHSPTRYRDVKHHIVPKSWGGTDTPDNIALICPTTHENVHDILNECVRFGRWPDWPFLMRFNLYTRQLADLAWVNRPSDKPPWTMANPTTGGT